MYNIKLRKIEDRPCKHCGQIKTMVGKQRVCNVCREKTHKLAALAWAKDKNNKERVDKKTKSLHLTFSFTNGKWFWEAPNGLTNGPFESIRSARKDARKAFGLYHTGGEE